MKFLFAVGDACKRCCRMSLNETCFPIDPQDILPDGTPCIQGFCNKVMLLNEFILCMFYVLYIFYIV